MSANHCCVYALISHFRIAPEVLEYIGPLGDSQLIKKGKSDCADLFFNFAQSIGDERLVCDAHCAGTSQFGIFKICLLEIWDFLCHAQRFLLIKVHISSILPRARRCMTLITDNCYATHLFSICITNALISKSDWVVVDNWQRSTCRLVGQILASEFYSCWLLLR